MVKKGAQRRAQERRNRQRSPSPAKTASRCTEIVGPSGNRLKNGLVNLGNTCFMNSILQCLNVSAPFSDTFLRLSSRGLDGVSGGVCGAFRGVRGLEGNSPKQLFAQLTSRFPWYQGRQMHDAHEFLRTILGSISDETPLDDRFEAQVEDPDRVSTKVGPNMPANDCEKCVWESFRGQLCAATLCWRCHKVSIQLEPFLDLSLELPIASEQMVAPLGVRSPGCLTLAKDILDEEEEEDLSPLNKREMKERKREQRAKSSLLLGPDDEKLAEDSISHKQSGRRAQRGKSILSAAPKIVDFPTLGGKAPRRPAGVWAKTRAGVSNAAIEEAMECAKDWVHTLVQNIQLQIHARTGARAFVMRLVVRVLKATEVPGQEAEHDNHSENQAALSIQNERNLEFYNFASAASSSLPDELRKVFSPDVSCRDLNDHLEIVDCFKHFAAVEAIEDNLQPTYQCSGCAEDGEVRSFASRRIWLWPKDCPPLLALHLKRFRRRGERWEKSPTPVRLPATMDLNDYAFTQELCASLASHLAPGSNTPGSFLTEQNDNLFEGGSSLRYELYAICVHEGASMQSGHYVAYLNAGPSLEQEDWYCVSDMTVTGSSREIVLKKEAYVAFYRRGGCMELP